MPRVSAENPHAGHARVENAADFAAAVARWAHELKTENVRVLDLRGVSTIADFFVLGTGTSDRQMRAVLDAIRENSRRHGRQPFATSTSDGATWMLADYVDVVIHIFDEEHRAYYDLDSLWGDAPELPWSTSNATQPANTSHA